MVFVTSFISGCKKTLVIKPLRHTAPCGELDQSETFITYQDILDIIYQKEGCWGNVCLSCEGKPVFLEDEFKGDINIVATLKLKGGKGGFGSMLRAIGAQIEKTTNREACRDLSGRRLRDINEEKRLKDYLGKKVGKEKERFDQKKKKLEQMKEGPKHVFEDKTYFEQREKRERDVYDSLDKAFSSGVQQNQPRPNGKKGSSQNPLKRKLMIADLDDSTSEESDIEEVTIRDSSSEEEEKEQQHVEASGTEKEEVVNERKSKNLRTE